MQALSVSLPSKLLHSLLRFGVSKQPACRRTNEHSTETETQTQTQKEQLLAKGAALSLGVQRVLHCLVDRRGNLERALALRIFETRDALEHSGAQISSARMQCNLLVQYSTAATCISTLCCWPVLIAVFYSTHALDCTVLVIL